MVFDPWVVAALSLCFALGFIVGRKDDDLNKARVVDAVFWQGFEIGYKAKEEELDNDEEL